MATAIEDMLDAYPAALGGMDRDKLIRCIEECIACAQACTACADACLAEEAVADLTRCIRTGADCADICRTTATVLSRRTGYDATITRAILLACATVCEVCGDECANHADQHDHCRVCADVCRRCEQACNDLLTSLG
ncbi:four-helix bundle copper-binding protein [Streptomyces sp. NPDC014623]|uniref:four-helix bundle copper-binding protein n=1 Tax=Streptomyces sp. NPDC014623 TaxID=3364875 RepID=UPI0036F8B31D